MTTPQPFAEFLNAQNASFDSIAWACMDYVAARAGDLKPEAPAAASSAGLKLRRCLGCLPAQSRVGPTLACFRRSKPWADIDVTMLRP